METKTSINCRAGRERHSLYTQWVVVNSVYSQNNLSADTDQSATVRRMGALEGREVLLRGLPLPPPE